jgi:hypothetical protein
VFDQVTLASTTSFSRVSRPRANIRTWQDAVLTPLVPPPGSDAPLNASSNAVFITCEGCRVISIHLGPGDADVVVHPMGAATRRRRAARCTCRSTRIETAPQSRGSASLPLQMRHCNNTEGASGVEDDATDGQHLTLRVRDHRQFEIAQILRRVINALGRLSVVGRPRPKDAWHE